MNKRLLREFSIERLFYLINYIKKNIDWNLLDFFLNYLFPVLQPKRQNIIFILYFFSQIIFPAISISSDIYNNRKNI